MVSRLLIIAALLLATSPALAERFDSRIVNEIATAKTAEVALLEAAMRALVDDAKKREAEWAEYSKPLWQIPDPAK